MAQTTTGATPFPLGVFVGNPNYSDSNEEANFEANFNAFSTLMKSKPQFLDQYGDQRLPVSQWAGQASWNAASMAKSPVLKDVTPVIGLPMTSTASGSGTPDQFYKAFAAGKYDSVLKDMVKAWADNGFKTQIWRPGWEMNINTMPSYAGDDAAIRADWVKAFQHISTVLHAAGQAEGVKVQVAWNPSVVNYSHAGNVIQTAYPGNQYVDIIAADVYGDVFPYGSPTHLYDWDKSGRVLNSSHPVYDSSVRQWAADPVNLEHYYTYPASNQWSLDGSEGHATTLQQLIDLAKSTGKPFAIAETSAGNTHDGAGLTDNPTFVRWLADTLHQSGVKVSFVNIWDSNSGGRYHFTSSADHKPLEAAAWAKYFGDPPTSASASAPATTKSSLAPTVTHVSASPGTGIEHAGDTITLTLGFNEALTVTGTPTLSLNDGASATYVGGSRTSALTFRTTVASSDTNTSALAITRVNLPSGASIKDASGVAANFAGAVKTFSGLQIAASSAASSTPTTRSAPSTSSTPSSIIAKDPVSGTVTKAAPHIVTVTDSKPATAPTPTSPPQTIVTDSSIGTGPDHGWWGQHRDSIANGGATTSATSTSTGLAGQRSALFSKIGDMVADRDVANSASARINAANAPRANDLTASSLASHSFALLNQSLASNTGRVDPGQIMAAGPNRATWAQDSFLTRPQH